MTLIKVDPYTNKKGETYQVIRGSVEEIEELWLTAEVMNNSNGGKTLAGWLAAIKKDRGDILPANGILNWIISWDDMPNRALRVRDFKMSVFMDTEQAKEMMAMMKDEGWLSPKGCVTKKGVREADKLLVKMYGPQEDEEGRVEDEEDDEEEDAG